MRVRAPGRRSTAVIAGLVALTLVQLVAPGFAWAAGPSVALPDPNAPAVSAQGTTPRPADEASTKALNGDQPTATTPRPVGGGTPTASPLSPSAAWQVSQHTGDFTWSYPLRVPPAPGGLVPKLALSYKSSTVDGRTSGTNNQPSWVGEGWDLSAGFIERTYGGCGEDDMGGTTPPKTGDLCWRGDNATASYPGGGGMLIAESGGPEAAGLWRAKSDDGSRIERLTGGGNGDNNGEYWKITTVDGTQYFFGSRPDAGSTWTVPVFGDDALEPCHAATFDQSHCVQAWRWNLDKVVDRHGNVMHHTYEVETNAYGRNLQDTAVPYARGGTLRKIEYGLRLDGSVPASGVVEFGTADRCVPGSVCTPTRRENWPDVPWNHHCDTATCKDNYSPSFWSTRRLAKVTTAVRAADGSYPPVDSWTLDQAYPNPGNHEDATLWLRGVTHTGHVGGTLAVPAVTFEGTLMQNRVLLSGGVGPMNRFRVTGVVAESGGVLSVQYAAPDCVADPASPEHNAGRCFPVRWTTAGGTERTDYFHKYVVASVAQSDRYDGQARQRTSYEYLDGAAWHFDTSEFVKDAKRTWNEFRGFGRVRVHTGDAGDPAGPVGLTEQRFHRGMDGDRLPGDARRSVTVTDSRGGVRGDADHLAGFGFESTTFNGDAVVATAVSMPTVQGPTATRGEYRAYLVRVGESDTHTALTGGAWRRTRTEYRYDDRGLLTRTDDLGDMATGADDRCVRTTYARNPAAWLLSYPSSTETVGVSCGVTPSYPADALGGSRVSYDNQAPGAAPVTGDATRTERMSERPASGDPVYVTASTAGYDAHGRMVTATNPDGGTGTVAYTPATGGPVTQTAHTNALGHVTTTTVEPAWGSPLKVTDPNKRLTETAYDPLGRASQVWLPNRKRPTSASAKFSYLMRQDAPTVVTTSVINPRGTYTTTKQIYDGLLRLRQTQSPAAAGGGRLLTDTRYDSHGREWTTTTPYYNAGPLDDTLWTPSDVSTVGMTVTGYDGAGRPTASAFKGGGVEKWRTTTGYDGDRVHVGPPAGGTPTTTVYDARGRKTELRQYDGGPAGSHHATKYAYDRAGQLASITDAMGNAWRYTYDLRGRQIRAEDPDKGPSTVAYDDMDRVTAVTDARGGTVRTAYDKLGRTTSIGQDDSTPFATWTYDTAGAYGKGLPAGETRHVGTAAYSRTVSGYTALNKPLDVTVTVPETEQTLAGSYTTGYSYDPAGNLAQTTLPAIGDLPAETIVHNRNELGLATTTHGGMAGQTHDYVTDSRYTEFGAVARVQLGTEPKRVWQSYYYDDHTRRLNRTIIDAEAPAPMQNDIRYTYDPAGTITSIVDAPRDRTADTQCFRYDQLRRLTDAWTPGGDCAGAPATPGSGGTAAYRHSYTYDKVGNRLTETRHATSGDVVTTHRYPQAGAARPHAVTSVTAGGTVESYGYDATGNMTERPGQTLQWDIEGYLTKVSTTAGDTSFVYDAVGSRLIRRTPQASTLTLDGQELTLNRATGVRTAARYYTHGGKTVAVRTGGKLTWLAGDHQGTSQVGVDADSMAVTQRRQTPFGGPRGTAVDLPGELGFVGGTEDPSTGLVHVGAREYDPKLGRFISVDPVMGNEPQLLNAYAYSNNSPVTFSDPTGLHCDSCDFYADTKGESSAFDYQTSYCDGCDYTDKPSEQHFCDGCESSRKPKNSDARNCDSCGYYDERLGEPSVWVPEPVRSSFCDSCDAYAEWNSTFSTWHRMSWGAPPTVFEVSSVINARVAEEQRIEAEDRERQEEADCGFWCGVWENVKEVTDSKAFKFVGLALGVAAMFGCAACGLVSVGMSLLGTGSDCAQGKWADCGVGVASLGLGFAGGVLVGRGHLGMVATGPGRYTAHAVGTVQMRRGIAAQVSSLGLDYLAYGGVPGMIEDQF